jgi:SNF2 family DNA or RNA helicase
MGGYMNRVVVGVQNPEELSSIIEGVSFRARKSEWTDLPEKLYTARSYDLTAKQRMAYGSMLRDLVILLEKEKVVTAPLAVTQLLKLSQVSSGFVHDGEGKANDLVAPKDNPKLNLLEELLDEIAGKVVVFANFRRTIELCKQRWPDAPTIEGGMDPQTITANVRKFNDTDSKVIFCQVTSAKYGLTLLGKPEMPCSTTIYLENSYSLDARAQSEDRNHRHGQKNPVLYIDVIGTKVEHAALSILAAKQELSAAILDRGSALRKALKAEL